jgi:hypothetical protein
LIESSLSKNDCVAAIQLAYAKASAVGEGSARLFEPAQRSLPAEAMAEAGDALRTKPDADKRNVKNQSMKNRSHAQTISPVPSFATVAAV